MIPDILAPYLKLKPILSFVFSAVAVAAVVVGYLGYFDAIAPGQSRYVGAAGGIMFVAASWAIQRLPI